MSGSATRGMVFVRAYPRESQEMVFDAHERAFAFFKGACARGIYDNLWTSPAQGALLAPAAGMHESIRPVAGRFCAPLAMMGVRGFRPHNMIGLEGLVVNQAWKLRSLPTNLWTSPAQGALLAPAAGMHESIRPVAGRFCAPLAMMGVRGFRPHNMIGLEGLVVNQAWKLRSLPTNLWTSPAQGAMLAPAAGMHESIRPVAGRFCAPLAMMGVRGFRPHNMIGLEGLVVNQAWKLRSLPTNLWTSPAQGALLAPAAGMHESIRPVAGRFCAPLAMMGVRGFRPHNMIGLEGLVVNQAWKLRSLPTNLWTSPAQGALLAPAAGMHESIRPVAGRFCAPLAMMGVRGFRPHNMIGLEGLARAASMKACLSVPGLALRMTRAKSRGDRERISDCQLLAISRLGLRVSGTGRPKALGRASHIWPAASRNVRPSGV